LKKEVQALLKIAPSTVKVGAYPWSIVYSDKFVMGADEKEKWGLCSYAEHKLSIGNLEGMPSTEMLVGIVLHELFHAIWGTQNLKNRDTEENVIMAFETGLLQVLKDNPDLFRFIQKGIQ
jgi:hypothetical protein